jgi:hypothetical protein
MARQPQMGQGLLIVGAWRSHSDKPHSLGLLCTGDQPDTEIPTWQHTNTQKREAYMHPPAFEPAVPASERPQTQALDRAATGFGNLHT